MAKKSRLAKELGESKMNFVHLKAQLTRLRGQLHDSNNALTDALSRFSCVDTCMDSKMLSIRNMIDDLGSALDEYNLVLVHKIALTHYAKKQGAKL